MVRRLYIHNFRCLENFELSLARHSSVLLIGNNGCGKTSVGMALRVLQQIARGTNRVGELVTPKDLSQGRADVPIRIEIEAELGGRNYAYGVAFEFPEGFRELRVLDEKLTVDGQPVYSRQLAQVHIAKKNQGKEAEFNIDWHLVALPIIQGQPVNDPVTNLRRWLAQMLILRPIPAHIGGESKDETLQPNLEVTDFAAWLTGVLTHSPSAYARIDQYLKQVIPDLADIKNPATGKDTHSLEVYFSKDQASLKIDYADLSDGEKCFMISALVIAANEAYGPLLCFWDEPDNYLTISEVSQFLIALRKAFRSGGQLIATSHNPEAVRAFSDENTFVLYRRSHMEPVLVRSRSEIGAPGGFAAAFTRGDVEP